MRPFWIPLLLVPVAAQTPPFHVLIGNLTTVSGDRIVVTSGVNLYTLFSDAATDVWRGKHYKDFSVLHVGDELTIRYKAGPTSHPVVIDLSANIEKVEGTITALGANRFQVDENPEADPQSAYRRGLREIVFDAETHFDDSLPEDLKLDRHVFVIGLKLDTEEVQATRVIVYEGNRPVRMNPDAVVVPAARQR